MKIHHRRSKGHPSASVGHLRGMTLVEMILAVGIGIGIVTTGLVSVNLMGLREDELIESKGGASETSREALNSLLEDIRSAKGYYIGTYAGGTNFTAISNSVPQQAVSVLLYPVVNSTNGAVDTSQQIIYYYDLTGDVNSNGILWRYYYTNGVQLSSTVIASNLIPPMYFTSENFQGYTQADRTFKGVVHTKLSFCQFQYPTTQVGSNCLFDTYTIDCRATPHLPDGP